MSDVERKVAREGKLMYLAGVQKNAPAAEVNAVAVPREMSEDPFRSMEEAGDVVPPPFDMRTLAEMWENNSELGPCIDAMVTNIDSFGHRLEPRFEVSEATPESVKKALAAEERRAWNFFTNCTYDSSFQMARRRLRHDLESTGNGYWEMVSRGTELVGVNHIPATSMRLGPLQAEYVPWDEPRLEWLGEGEYAWRKVKGYKRFRRFVQIKEGMKVYFKEFGDPRVMNWRTGAYGPCKPEEEATEILHFKLYCSRSPYGLPRWIGALFCLYGTRAADEINYVTFKNNNVPSMAILVSNGQLTQESIDRITQYIEAQIAGSDNRSKFVVLEGEPAAEGLKESPNIKIAVEPLVKVQHNDAMFSNYTNSNNDRTRRMFRLPPLLVGKADEYTRATADAARKVADEQIFRPERDEFDAVQDRTVLARLGIAMLQFKSNAPSTTDSTELVNILAQAERTGGLTPNIARMIIGSIFGRSLGRVEEKETTGGTKFDGDLPFTLTLAEAVKNTGPVRSGTLPYGSKPATDKTDVPGAAEPMRITSAKAVEDPTLVQWAYEQVQKKALSEGTLAEAFQRAMVINLGLDPETLLSEQVAPAPVPVPAPEDTSAGKDPAAVLPPPPPPVAVPAPENGA